MTQKATENLNLPPQHSPEMASCKQCGKPFEQGQYYWKRFCSSKCRQQFQYQLTKQGRALLTEQMNKSAA